MQMQAYLIRAVDYYIFARKAVMLGVVPVGGNLFHNAMEMIFHCGLSVKYSQDELEKKFSKHELTDMWLEFKKIFDKKNLTRFDQFVSHHKQWKYIRYPKRKIGKKTIGNSIIFFSRKKADLETMKQKNLKQNKDDIQIHINLDEMDEFMNTVIRSIGINPNFVKIHLQHNIEIMNLYLNENNYPLFDLKTKVKTSTLLL